MEDDIEQQEKYLPYGTLFKEEYFMSMKYTFDQVSKSQSLCPKGTDLFDVSSPERVGKLLMLPEGGRRGQCWEGLTFGIAHSKKGTDKSGEVVLILIQQEQT